MGFRVKLNLMAKVLVTGATGYIGGRLIPRLLEEGDSLRCMVRNQYHTEGKSWAKHVEVVEADVLQADTLEGVFDGVETAYYLIHSMSAKDGFEERDKQAATNFAEAAKAAGVKHIVYLGGLGDASGHMSKHLKSRQETGACLASTGLPVTEFRAAIIVGSGSISFEMIRYLTERLPIMITPSWVNTNVQPIAIRDVLSYLLQARERIPEGHHIVEIGSDEVLRYKDLMLVYADVRGLKRTMIPVPVLSPKLSSYWVNLVTPIPGSIATPLVEGLTTEVIVNHPEAARAYDVTPIAYREAVELALDRAKQGKIETLWSESFYEPTVVDSAEQLSDKEGLLFDKRVRRFAVSPESAFKAVARIGGEEGWYTFNWLWKLRGLIDRLFGGIGMRRGRRNPDMVVPGDIMDFWRVEAVEPNKHLQLYAEMKLPGQAWLRFDIEPCEDGQTEIKQVAYYEPKGLFGYLYWWSVYPFHVVLFPRMLQKIGEHARAMEASPDGKEATEGAAAASNAVAAEHQQQ